MIKKALLFTSLATFLPIGYFGLSKNKFDKLAKTRKIDILDNKPNGFDDDLYKKILLDNLNYIKVINHQDYYYDTYDGYKLYGLRLNVHDNHRLIIMLHATNKDHFSLLNQARIFIELGYDVLLIDSRSYSKSEGTYSTFGFKESFDLANLINKLTKEDKELEIGLYGISLGSSTIIQYLKNKINKQVKFAIVEGSYISFKSQLNKHYHDEFFISGIEYYFKKILNFDIKELDNLQALRYNKLPILFLHADNDQITRLDDVKKLYEASDSFKMLHVFNSESNLSSNLRCADYSKVIENFIKVLK